MDANRLGSQKNHLIYLDSIRGIAALSVVLGHYIWSYGLFFNKFWQHIWTYTPLVWLWDGSAAVSMFFVLSGLVLSLRHFRSSRSPNLAEFDFRGFFISRVCRIWLPYIAVLAASLILEITIGSNHTPTIPPRTEWISQFWSNSYNFSSLAQGATLFFGHNGDLMPQSWTLTIELVLSLTLPMIIIVTGRSTAWVIFFGLLSVTAAGFSVFILHFIMGVLLAKHFSHIQNFLTNRTALRRCIFVAAMCLYGFRYTFGSYIEKIFHRSVDGNLIYLISGVGSMAIISCCMSSRRLQDALSKSYLVFIGRVSYSFYLIHFIILICLTPRFLILVRQQGAAMAWCGGLLITFISSFLLSILVYNFIEVPSVAVGKRLTYLLEKGRR